MSHTNEFARTCHCVPAAVRLPALPLAIWRRRAGFAPQPSVLPMARTPDDQPPERQAYTGETIAMPRRPTGGPPRLPRPTPRRVWPTIRKALLIILALTLLALIVFYLQIRSVAAKVVVPDARPNPPIASPLFGGVNVLVVGVDERPDHPEEGVRSDTLVVVHLDGPGRWASLLSIPRDTRVNIRDIGETKINVAYGQGYARAAELYGPNTTPQEAGMALAAETVEQFLQLRIDYVAQVNFDGFAKIIDALGGITIDVPKPIVDDAYPTPDLGTTRIEFQPGLQRMDGARALIYARTRHADSDFGRAERQQQVIQAITAEIRRRGLFGQASLLPGLLDGLQGAVATTMPIARLDVLAGLALIGGGLDAAELGRVRISPESVPNYREEGSDLIWDPEGVRAVVAAFLTRTSAADEQATVQVLNGTGVDGLAGRVSTELEQAGFTVIPAGNAPNSNASQTVVYDLTDKPHTSRRLAETLGAALQRGPLPAGATSSADIVIVLGQDAISRRE